MIPKVSKIEKIYPTRDSKSKARNPAENHAQGGKSSAKKKTTKSACGTSSHADFKVCLTISSEGNELYEQSLKQLNNPKP